MIRTSIRRDLRVYIHDIVQHTFEGERRIAAEACVPVPIKTFLILHGDVDDASLMIETQLFYF